MQLFQVNQSHTVSTFVLGGLWKQLQFLTLEFETYKGNEHFGFETAN